MMKYLFLVFSSLFAFSGCNSDSLLGQPRPLKTEAVKEKPKLKNKFSNPKLDILFVVDNSGSMNTHQSNISTNIDSFTNTIFQNTLIDFHIGVTTSDIADNGKLVAPFITKNTPNKEATLSQNILMGTGGSGTEFFFEPVEKALSAGVNPGFHRSDAFLAIIFITDTGPSDSLTNNQLFSLLVNLKSGDSDKVLSYGAIIPPPNAKGCLADSEWVYIDKLINFINMTGGAFFDLCSADFGKELAKIGGDLADKLQFVVNLDKIPVVETIVVEYGTQIIPQDPIKGWTYDPNLVALRFGKEVELKEQPGVTSLSVSFKPANRIQGEDE